MKNILILLFTVFAISSKAQSPIINRYYDGNYGEIVNAYYKDLTNLHDQYVGTWIYINGNTSLKIVFVKKDMFFVSGHAKNYYADFLVGEYQYIENGVEKVNTLSNLVINHTDIDANNLKSYSAKWKSTYPQCLECNEEEKRLVMRFEEPSRRNIYGLSNQFILRRYVENGTEKLKVWFLFTGLGIFTEGSFDGPLSEISSFSLPFGEYTLTKQP